MFSEIPKFCNFGKFRKIPENSGNSGKSVPPWKLSYQLRQPYKHLQVKTLQKPRVYPVIFLETSGMSITYYMIPLFQTWLAPFLNYINPLATHETRDAPAMHYTYGMTSRESFLQLVKFACYIVNCINSTCCIALIPQGSCSYLWQVA